MLPRKSLQQRSDKHEQKNWIWQLVLWFRHPWVGSQNRWQFRGFRGLLLRHSSYSSAQKLRINVPFLLDASFILGCFFIVFLPWRDVVYFGSSLVKQKYKVCSQSRGSYEIVSLGHCYFSRYEGNWEVRFVSLFISRSKSHTRLF